MIYEVNLTVHFLYEVDADNIENAKQKGITAFYNDECKDDLTPEICFVRTVGAEDNN